MASEYASKVLGAALLQGKLSLDYCYIFTRCTDRMYLTLPGWVSIFMTVAGDY